MTRSLSEQSELGKKIARVVAATEPMSIAQYMHICMSDPEHGYYATGNPIGREGDFVTAPEVSQMFGEMIGIWVMQVWDQMGRPDPFNLVEPGPGRGILMSDLLRASATMSGFSKAVQVHLVETGKSLKKAQETMLSNSGISITWHEDFSTLPEGPVILVANEFLDVLPFRQFVKQDGKWHERLIAADENGNLQFVLGQAILEAGLLPTGATEEPDGAVFEAAPAREAIMQQISELVASNRGAALLIDYGHSKTGFGDTFQALSRHQYADPLKMAGKADLTSHVDFEALSKAVRLAEGGNELVIHPPMKQGDFLLGLGLLERAGMLGHDKSADVQARLKSEAERLALPGQMGDLFKCLCFHTKGLDPAPFSGNTGTQKPD